MSPPTLPGDIVGLLKRGSPIIMQTGAGPRPGVVMRFQPDGEVMFAWTGEDDGEQFDTTDPLPPRALALDLSDPTGRAHAAWWLRASVPRGANNDRIYPGATGEVQADVTSTAHRAMLGMDMDVNQVFILRRACLAVAGR